VLINFFFTFRVAIVPDPHHRLMNFDLFIKKISLLMQK